MYPDTASDDPALTAEEWIGGKNAPPKLVSFLFGNVISRSDLSTVSRCLVTVVSVVLLQSNSLADQASSSLR